MKVCAEPGCEVLLPRGIAFCGEHKPDRRAADREIKARSEWRWVYKSPRWAALRRQVKAEQPFCDVVNCFELTHDVDHILALQDGGFPFARENVHGMCKRHHSEKTREEIRARKATKNVVDV